MLRKFITAAIVLGASASLPAMAETRSLVVAGGCFWCVESDFDKVAGVVNTTSGYGGGTMQNPTYRNHGDHREVVKIDYDSDKTDYKTLVTTFLRTIDPTDGGGQFCDRGHSYTPAIHASSDAERKQAEAAVADAAAALGQDLAVPVEGKAAFWPAEEYHQDYYKSQVKQLTRFGLVSRAKAYKGYRAGCGRDQQVRAVWGDMAYQGVAGH